jgi:nicotinate phosphoribosyltransferase
LVFSDSLDIPRAIGLTEKFEDEIEVVCGIGTNLTNDLGVPVPQNVIKLASVNGRPVAKLSANPAKATSPNAKYLEYVKSLF